MTERSHYEDRAAGRVHEDEYCPYCTDGRLPTGSEKLCGNPGCKPDRPDMDGGRTDDIAMLSEPLWLEHGEEGGVPVMGMYATVRPDWKLLFDEPYDWCSCSSPRDHVHQDIEEFLVAHYGKCKPGFGVEFRVQDVDWRSDGAGTKTATAEVYIEAEWWADEGYDGGEGAGDYSERVARGTQFFDFYNHFIIFFTGQERLEEHLRNLQPPADSESETA